MTLETALAFALGMVILMLTPGPSMLTTIAKSLATGFWTGFQYNIGVYGSMAARARKIFRSGRAVKVLNRSAGSAMIGAGLYIATR